MAGALIFRGGGGSRKINSVTLHCGSGYTPSDCDDLVARTLKSECRGGADAVKLTVVHYVYVASTGTDAESERRTTVEDC